MATIDPHSGFCSKTLTFHSLRPKTSLPPKSQPISVTDYIFSLLPLSTTSSSSAAAAFIQNRRIILYDDLILRVKTLASSLQNNLHLSQNDVALLLAPNSIDIPLLYLSLLSIGVIISPANPASTRREISRQIELSNPAIAFVNSDSSRKISSFDFKLGVIDIDSPEFQLLKVNSNSGECRVSVSQSDTAAILYSSGTTGEVKGVELTHRNLIASLAAANRNVPAIWLSTVPYFHVYGMILCLRCVASGGTLVTMTSNRRFDLVEMYRVIQEFRVSHLAASPAIIVTMVNNRGGLMDGCDLTSLRVVGCGGSSLQKNVIEKFRQLLPNVDLAQAYGLTESTGRIFSTEGENESKVIGATGKLMPNCQAKIIDSETGIALSPWKPGELFIKGPSIFKGYVGDKEATRAAFDMEGWFKTGDLCYIDNHGFLFFLDRIKELIKYKGFQVHPVELENLLLSHPDIVEAAVIPYPDEEAGQVPVAFIVRRIGSAINESEIKSFIAEQVAPYKRIRYVMFIDSIPKNALGKVLRKDLIKLAFLTTNSKL